MAGGKPGAKPGTPSPNKKFWVIRAKGSLVRFELPGNRLPPGLPTYFKDAKAAGNAAQLLNEGSEFPAEVFPVTRKWLESLARGEKPEVKVATLPTRIPIVNFGG